jgi:ABC-type branched-subunit amino acid transport system substrate-binding protein
MRTHIGWRRLVALLAVLTLFTAACGGGDDDTGAGSNTDPTPTTAETGATPGATPTAGTDDGTPTSVPVADPEPTIGFDGETIRLGYLTDQSGNLRILGEPLLVGSQVYWDWVNEELGGIGGRYRVELVAGDTKDDSAVAVQEYQRLKGDVALFSEILSTPPTQAVLEFLKQDGVIGVPGSLAGAWAGERNLLPTGAAYDYEIINLADWFVNESGLGSADSVACAVSVDDLYGESTMKALRYAAGELGFTLAEEQTIARGDGDFSATISAFDGAGCEVVYAVTLPTEQNGILAEALAQDFTPTWLAALPADLNLYARGAPDRYADFYTAVDAPALSDRSVKGMADFLDRWATYGDGEPNTFHASGYLQQIAVRALLEKAVAMGDLSRDGLLAAADALGEVEMDGLTANYVYGEPSERVPASANRIFRFDRDAPPNLLTEVDQIDSALNAGYPLF